MFWLWKIFKAKKPYQVEILLEEGRHWRAIIRDWQNREKRHGTNETDVPIYFYGKSNVVYAKRILREVQKRIDYISDIEQYKRINHYPTSKQVWTTDKDDCDGQAIAVWKALELQEFPADEIGMGVVDGHMFAVWHDPELINDFWVLDNGFLSRKMVKASKLFPCKYRGRPLEPLYGFNVNSWWSYVKI